ncbi:MAG TPA: endonuclease Q family protein [Desulfobacteria bacterium]|nr:endonuclease Q family protein [Desulfobacteria bacterium]
MKVFADLHIHIGRSTDGRPVKITAANSLTVENIVYEAAARKGIQLIGIVDAGSPGVLKDLHQLVDQGYLTELPGGGLTYQQRVCLIPGIEVETSEKKGAAHVIAYLPNLASVEGLARQLQKYVTNPQLSTQKAALNFAQFWDLAATYQGIVVPAHIFTPHKGIYGSCCDSFTGVLRPDQFENLAAIELGLSSDTQLAQQIGELARVPFLSNSDAHSLAKIGREYNQLAVKEVDFANFLAALKGKDECRITANFGLDPKLGKYHRTFCEECSSVVSAPPPVLSCPNCGSHKVVIGVLDRITELAETPGPEEIERPPYIHQVPLQFLPGLGGRTLERLLNHFGTEMNILHDVDREDLARVVGSKLAENIIASRQGNLPITAGGGGLWGKVRV